MAFESFKRTGNNVWEGSKNIVKGLALVGLAGLALYYYAVPALTQSVGASIAGVMPPDVFSTSPAISGVAQTTFGQVHAAGMV